MTESRHLLLILTVREFKNRYLSTGLGLIWALILPLALLAIYAFVFTQIFQMRFPGLERTGFVPYLAVALWPWLAFSESVMRSATSVTENEALIGKVALPHAVLVQSSVCASFALHLIGYVLVLVVLAATGTAIEWSGLPLLIGTMVAIFGLTLGFSLVVAATQVYIRDVTHALGPLFMFWFFATPIIYPAAMVPDQYRSILDLNPMTPLMDMIRAALLESDATLGIQHGVAVGFCVAVLILGRLYFHRLSRHFEDFL